MRVPHSLEDFYLREQVLRRCLVQRLLCNHLHGHHLSAVSLRGSGQEPRLNVRFQPESVDVYDPATERRTAVALPPTNLSVGFVDGGIAATA